MCVGEGGHAAIVLAGHLECQELFNLLPLCWDLEFVHKHFKSAVLISYRPPILSFIIPTGFQNQLRRETYLTIAGPQDWSAQCRAQSLLLREDL